MSASTPDVQTNYLVPDPDLCPGSVHAGFEVISATPVPEVSGTVYVMRHQASGARAMWIACADNNKSFAIAFKTPPADDTGVFHIIEHSVLCGSDAYPVKEPFVNLLKTSMQTFLNALTYSDKTVYPVASTNTKDLENLMGVYLDAVLHPAIYERPRIFEQEGWHYELSEDGKTLTRNGVVLNEMRGSFSDPDARLFLELERSLFPDSPYGRESGGTPDAIPTLSYERFIDAHARHYALPNSYTILYGNMDIERELAFIDERFRGAVDRGAGDPNPLPAQAPVVADDVAIEMATSPDNASVALGYVVKGDLSSGSLSMEVLVDALCGSNEAPLKRRVLDEGLADDFQAFLVDGVLQPFVVFMLKGVRDPEGAMPRFRKVVEDFSAQLVRDGIPHDKLAASLSQAEFNLREGDYNSTPDGVVLALRALSSWLYDDDRAVDYLRYEDELADLHKGLDEGLFEKLLSDTICESEHNACVQLNPVDQGPEAPDAEELAELLAGMGEATRADIRREQDALRVEQETPDSPEALATLPRLGIADIEQPAPEPQPTRPGAPLPCIAHELDTHRIDYVFHYFDVRRVGFAELPYVRVLVDLLGKLDTRQRTASELDTLIEQNLGELTFSLETYAHDDDPGFARPTLVVSASALSDKVEALASIPQEVWGQTLFVDLDRIRDVLVQRKVGMEEYFLSAGHTAAMARNATHFSSAALVSSQFNGIDYYLFLKRLLADWDSRKNLLADLLHNLADRIFTADEVVVSFVGSEEDRTRFWEIGGNLGLEEQGGNVSAHQLEVPAREVVTEGFVIPSDVNYVARTSAPRAVDRGSNGSWAVASKALTLDYLWNEVRVKGGAYGVGVRASTDGVRGFWSYRDPNVDATLANYDGAVSWMASWEPEDDELTGYIVSSVASVDAPVNARRLAKRQDVELLSDRPKGWRAAFRNEILATTAQDVRDLAPALTAGTSPEAICVFGPRAALEAAEVDLEIHELIGGEEA